MNVGADPACPTSPRCFATALSRIRNSRTCPGASAAPEMPAHQYGVVTRLKLLKFLGAAGYRELARQIMDVRARLQAGIRAIPELELIGDPEIGLFCYGSPSLDIRSVAEAMSRRGWLPGINADPPAIHLFLVPLHAVMVDDYLADLGVAVEEVRSGRVAAKPAALVY